MSTHTDTLAYGGAASWSAPANLIGSTVQVTVVGGGGQYNFAASVTASVPIAMLPLHIVVGQGGAQGTYEMNGGVGFSGGAGAGGDPSTVHGQGGGASSAVLSGNGVSGYTLLVEAGGGDGLQDNYAGGTLGPPFTAFGGTGGGYASNTPGTTGGGLGSSGSGGAQGGNGGTGYTGGTPSSGGTGAAIGGSSINGNNGAAGAPGAGVGSGGLALSGIIANSFVNTSIASLGYTYGVGSAAGGKSGGSNAQNDGNIFVTYRVADAPSAPGLDSPLTGQFVDGLNDGVTFEGTYNVPGSDTGALEAVRLLLKAGGGSWQYWNGASLQGSPANAPLATGLDAISGGTFTVIVPPGIMSDNTLYQYSFQTIESYAGLVSPSANPVQFDSIQFPTVLITAPVEEAFVATLTPTITWADTIPSGSQIDYRVVLYETLLAPTEPPATTDATAQLDTGVVSSAAMTYTVPYSALLSSVTGYTAFVQIHSSGGAPSNWAKVDFTVELDFLAPPTLTALPVTEPSTGMPSSMLTMTARDNLVTPLGSTMIGNYAPSGVNGTVILERPFLSADVPGEPTGWASWAKAIANGDMSVKLDRVGADAGDTFYCQLYVQAESTARVTTLYADWLSSSGTVLQTDTIATTSPNDASSLPPLQGATGTGPASTASIQLRVTWASCVAGERHGFSGQAIFPGSAASTWYAGVGILGSPAVTATGELSEWQADYIGDGSWVDCVPLDPLGVALMDPGVGTSHQTFDMSAAFNVPIAYRVRNLVGLSAFSASGVNYPAQTLVSDWSTVVDVAEVPSGQWWIVPPSDPTLSLGLHRLHSTSATSSNSGLTSPVTPPTPRGGGVQTTIAIDEQEQMGVFRSFGRSVATVVHGDIWDPEFDLSLYFENPEEFSLFKTIRGMQEVVLVKSDMEGALYWVTLGTDLNRGIFQETGRRITPTSGLTIHCIPADPAWG
jgi:hypothetical protein